MDNYEKNITKLGKISVSIILLLIIMVPLVISLYFDIFPPFEQFISGFLQVIMIYIPISIAEFFTFVPILGKGGSYLAFMTGNLTNLKIPCATIAIDKSGYEKGSREADVIATISIAVSAITTIIVIALGLILIIPITPILSSPVLKPAFSNILPALFGALGAHFFVKQWKLAVVPIIASAFIAFMVIHMLHLEFTKIQGLLIPILGVISLLSALTLYKKGIITKEDIEEGGKND